MNARSLFFVLPALVGFTQCGPSGGPPSASDPTSLADGDGATTSSPEDQCLPIRAVACGEEFGGDTVDWNSGITDAMDHYPVAVGNYAAPEAVFALEVTATGEATLALVDPSPSVLNHDLFVLDADLGCRSEAAIAQGFNSVSFDAIAGHAYYLVVDGYDDAAGPFVASIDCAASAPSDDPFADLPDVDGGLTNLSPSLDAVLEDGALAGACARWSGDPAERADMLLCGKEMFFYEGFGSLGVPAAIFDFMSNKLTDTVGPAFSDYGLVPDPYSSKGRPLGFPVGAPFAGRDTVAWGCASCHFGQLPDGRYSVGYANQDYAYGTHNLSLLLAAQAANPMFDASDFEPTAIAAVQDVVDRITGDWWLRTQFVTALIPLIGGLGDVPGLTLEQQAQYASWAPGVLDAMIAPMPLDDGVAIPARIKDLWSIPGPQERAAWGLDGARLGWNGDGPDLYVFLGMFVDLAGGDVDAWPEERLTPLVEYMLSLRPPDNPQPLPSADVDRGQDVFAAAGCGDCHDGPRGLGTERVTYAEIGTDDAYRQLLDPDGTGTQFDLPAPLSHMLAPPRLTGLWTKDRLLHNGSVQGLDELLCVDGPRTPIPEHGFGNQGHEAGCELADDDKDSLIAFLLTL
jgi:hypothetical protein